MNRQRKSRLPEKYGRCANQKASRKKGDTPADAPTNMGTNQPADAPDYIKTKTETKLKELSLSLDELSFVSFEF